MPVHYDTGTLSSLLDAHHIHLFLCNVQAYILQILVRASQCINRKVSRIIYNFDCYGAFFKCKTYVE